MDWSPMLLNSAHKGTAQRDREVIIRASRWCFFVWGWMFASPLPRSIQIFLVQLVSEVLEEILGFGVLAGVKPAKLSARGIQQ